VAENMQEYKNSRNQKAPLKRRWNTGGSCYGSCLLLGT